MQVFFIDRNGTANQLFHYKFIMYLRLHVKKWVNRWHFWHFYFVNSFMLLFTSLMEIFLMTYFLERRMLFSSAELWLSSLKQRLTKNLQRLTTLNQLYHQKLALKRKNNHVVCLSRYKFSCRAKFFQVFLIHKIMATLNPLFNNKFIVYI